MRPLRVLITNNTLALRAGTELYVRDLALGLLARGHFPVAYSTVLGEAAEELRSATVPVIDDLAALAAPPDVIHGHHHLETLMTLLRFPGTPAVSCCHGWLAWEEAPPRHPRILRYVAVDHTCRDRLVCEEGIPPERVRVILNFVDLERFRPRGPLPERPRSALVFANYASETGLIAAAREACARAGLGLDVVGKRAGNAVARPEEVLGRYDLVFAKARAALEAMAVGAAVVLSGDGAVGTLVTAAEFDRLRPLNFGVRALAERMSPEALLREIGRYDARDAALVSGRVRAEAGREAAVEEILALYEEVIAEHALSAGTAEEELRAASAYLRRLAPRLKERDALHRERRRMEKQVRSLEKSLEAATNERLRLEKEVAALKGSAWFRWRGRLAALPGLRPAWRWVFRQRSAGRPAGGG